MNPHRTNKKPARETICGYCFDRMATGYDHILPVSFRVDNTDSNLYPSCRRCNSIAYNKIFNSLEEKREYVRQRLKARGQWGEDQVSKLQETIQAEKEMAKILFCGVSLGKMEFRKPKKIRAKPQSFRKKLLIAEIRKRLDEIWEQRANGTFIAPV